MYCLKKMNSDICYISDCNDKKMFNYLGKEKSS